MHPKKRYYGRSKTRTVCIKVGWIGCKMLFGWYFLLCGIVLLTASIAGIVFYDLIILYDITSHHPKYKDFESLLVPISSRPIPITHEWILETTTKATSDTKNWASEMISQISVKEEEVQETASHFITTTTTTTTEVVKESDPFIFLTYEPVPSADCLSVEGCQEVLFSSPKPDDIRDVNRNHNNVKGETQLLHSNHETIYKRDAYTDEFKLGSLREKPVQYTGKNDLDSMKNTAGYSRTKETGNPDNNTVSHYESFPEFRTDQANNKFTYVNSDSFSIKLEDVSSEAEVIDSNIQPEAYEEENGTKLVDHVEPRYLDLPAVEGQKRLGSTEHFLQSEDAAFDTTNLFREDLSNLPSVEMRSQETLHDSGDWKRNSAWISKRDSHVSIGKLYDIPRRKRGIVEYGNTILKKGSGNKHFTKQRATSMLVDYIKRRDEDDQVTLRIVEMIILSGMVFASSVLHLLVAWLLCPCRKARAKCCCCCCGC